MKLNIIKILTLITILSFHSLAWAELPTAQIAVISDLSGPLSKFCHLYNLGMDFAAQRLKERGLVDLKIKYEDHQLKPALAVNAYKKLSELDGVKIFIVNMSGPTLAIKPLSERNQHLLFSIAAHDQILTDAQFVFRYASRSDQDAEVGTQKIVELQSRSVGLISMQNEWALNYHHNLLANLKQHQVLHYSEMFLPSDTDYRSILLNLIKRKIDLLVVNSLGNSIAQIIIQARELGYTGQILANNGLALSPEAMDILKPKAIKSLLYQDYPAPPENFQKHFLNYNAHEAGPFPFFGYQAIELLGIAIAKVGTDPEKITKYLKSTGTVHGEFQEINITASGEINIKTFIKAW